MTIEITDGLRSSFEQTDHYYQNGEWWDIRMFSTKKCIYSCDLPAKSKASLFSYMSGLRLIVTLSVTRKLPTGQENAFPFEQNRFTVRLQKL